MSETLAEVAKALARQPYIVVVLILIVLIVPNALQIYQSEKIVDRMILSLAGNVEQSNDIQQKQNQILEEFQAQQQERSQLLRDMLAIEQRTARAMEYCYSFRVPQGATPP